MVQKLTTNLTANDLGSSLNMLRYIVNNRIKNMVNTMLVVRVVAVNGDKIDVQTVVQDLDNNGTPIDNYLIPNVHYMNWQYGTNKLICKPAVGDVGVLIISKQDLSGLVKDGDSIAQTTGSFNIGDGVYIGGFEGMNGEATQFIEFDENVVNITGTGTITIKAPTVNVDATDATIKADNATIDSANIKLGGDGASKKIALDGDPVKSGATVVGNIVASSATTSSL